MSHRDVPSRLFTLSALIPGVSAKPAGNSDAALVARVRAQDTEAFRVLFSRHAPAVWRFVRDLMDDAVFADEGVQETFLRAWNHIHLLKDDTRLLGWLLGIARNVALEQLRARRRDRPRGSRELPNDAQQTESPFPQSDDALSPELLFLGRETEHLLGHALARLSDDRRAALLLRVDHGVGYEEIAATMGWTLPKVKNEIHRARLQLREALVQLQGDQP